MAILKKGESVTLICVKKVTREYAPNIGKLVDKIAKPINLPQKAVATGETGDSGDAIVRLSNNKEVSTYWYLTDKD